MALVMHNGVITRVDREGRWAPPSVSRCWVRMQPWQLACLDAWDLSLLAAAGRTAREAR